MYSCQCERRSDDMSDTNSHSNEQYLDTQGKKKQKCLRGIFFKLEYPYAHFATKGVNIDVLFPLVWEAICQLENFGFKVI